MDLSIKLRHLKIELGIKSKHIMKATGASLSTVSNWLNYPENSRKRKMKFEHARGLVQLSSGKITMEDCGL